MQNPKISVVMGVYNGGKYLSEAINSVLNQSYKDFEFIIVDDGSTDETKDILSSFNDPRIKIIRNEKNIGLTRSLNVGLNFAKGEFIARQDADDQSLSDRLKLQYEFMLQNSNIGLVGTFAEFIDDHNNVIGRWTMPVNDLELRDGLLRGNVFCHGSVMMRRTALEKAGFYREKFRYTQDYELWLRMADVSTISNIGHVLYKMYRGKNTISRRRLDQQLAYQVVAVELYRERHQLGYDNYDNLVGDDPLVWIDTYYHDSLGFLDALKKINYINYINEAVKYNDYIGSISIKLKLNRLDYKSNLFFYDLKGFLSVTYYFMLHVFRRSIH